MSARPRFSWLPRFLFRFTLGVSAALLLAVLLAPWLVDGSAHPHGWSRVLALFAHDATMRRTTIGSALGLAVTACVFFRTSTEIPRPAAPRKSPRPPPPPVNVVGA